MKLRRIAIADDSPAFAAAVAQYVAALPGYVLAGAAHTAGEAPALVQSALPDLLLLDLGVAPARGLELVRCVKALPGAPAVVAMTLFHSPEAALAAIHAGADALVGKETFVCDLTRVLAALFPAEIAA
jgi:DNA-binding NarL/FixJ family response regulator